jgi:ABC-2 type transport system ATP-binding protein
MSVIQLENVHKAFGGVRAVDGLTFAVESGQITGFLGANGAGKTTTIKMLMGFIRPDSGSFRSGAATPRWPRPAGESATCRKPPGTIPG